MLLIFWGTNLVTFFSLKSLEPLVISSSLGTYRLIDLKLVDEQLLLLRLWSVCGVWWVPLIYVNIYPKIPKINKTIL